MRREHIHLAGVVLALALALGCGRSVRREENDPDGGEAGTDRGATGGSATGGAAGSPGGGGPNGGTGAEAGTDPSGGQGNTAGAGRGGSGLGGASGSAGEAGSGGGAGGAGGQGDVPGFDDFIVRSNVMAAYEGLHVIATYDFSSGGDSRSDARWDVISNGTFELRWVEEFNRNSFGVYVVLFVDRGADALCTPGVDPAWMDFRSNLTEPGEPEILDFDPESDRSINGPISCDEFNTWFDSDYRPPTL